MNHAISASDGGFRRRVEVPRQFTHYVDWELAMQLMRFRGISIGAINLYIWWGHCNFQYVTVAEDHAIIWCVDPESTLDRYSFHRSANYRSAVRNVKELKDCGLLLNRDLRHDPWPRLRIDLRVVKELEVPNDGPDNH